MGRHSRYNDVADGVDVMDFAFGREFSKLPFAKESRGIILNNAYLRLRAQCLARSTRPFLARGAAVKRCANCLLGLQVCICPWRLPVSSSIDIVLLMHGDEVFKPTNTGRLIADVLPANTYAFEWSRLAPAAELLALLADPSRYPAMMFPDDGQGVRHVHASAASLPTDRRLTLVMLDGTWKQARKMFKTSHYLQSLPLLALGDLQQGQYAVRKAREPGQLSTAEAAAAALLAWGEPLAGRLIADYFAVFNQHYIATRHNVIPAHSEHHHRIESAKAAACFESGPAVGQPPQTHR